MGILRTAGVEGGDTTMQRVPSPPLLLVLEKTNQGIRSGQVEVNPTTLFINIYFL